MSRIHIPIFALFLLAPVTGCRAASAPPVLFQEIDLTLLPAEGKLTGRTTIRTGSGGTLQLLLAPRAKVRKVEVAGREATFRRTDETLSVTLPKADEVRIEYAATFNDPLPEIAAGTEDPSYGVAAVIAPEGTYLGGEALWYPEPATVPAQRRLTVHAPAGTSAITAGKLVLKKDEAGETVTVWEIDQPLQHLSLSAGTFAVTASQTGTVPVTTWLRRDDPALAQRYLSASTEYVDFYSRLLGPYPFPKFSVVENFLPTGYGFPSYTLIGGNVLRLPFLTTTSLPHEIVHNWWGNGVLADYARGNWSEGLTTYLADHLQEERKDSAAARSYRMKILADYATLVTPGRDFPLTRFTSRSDTASRSIGYGKGAMAFHLVRKMTGDEAFYGALRKLATERMFRRASWDDFANSFGGEAGNALREVASTEGALEITLSGVTAARTASGWRSQGSVSQKPLRTPVPVTLAFMKDEREIGRQTLRVGGSAVAFSADLTERPDRVVVDPEVDLFRRLSEKEIPFTINRIKGSRHLVAVRGGRCKAAPSDLRRLLDSLGHAESPIVPEGEAKPEQLADVDLVVCGTERPGFGLQLPQEVQVRAGAFTAEGRTFTDGGSTLLVAGPRAGRPERAVLLFAPQSAEAAADTATRITHYGGSSYLVFLNGKNVIKGLAAPAPLAVGVAARPGEDGR